MCVGFAVTAEDTPVRTQVVELFPVASPAAIMWSAAAQKSGVPQPGVYPNCGWLAQLPAVAAARW